VAVRGFGFGRSRDEVDEDLRADDAGLEVDGFVRLLIEDDGVLFGCETDRDGLELGPGFRANTPLALSRFRNVLEDEDRAGLDADGQSRVGGRHQADGVFVQLRDDERFAKNPRATRVAFRTVIAHEKDPS